MKMIRISTQVEIKPERMNTKMKIKTTKINLTIFQLKWLSVNELRI